MGRARAHVGASVALLAGMATAAVATGPERTLIIIDPSSARSMYVGNHYKTMRGIPDSNVLYMAPGASDYPEFVEENLAALFGTISQRRLEGQIDVVVVMPGAPFFVSAPGLVAPGGCPAPVTRFSISGAYTTAFIADEVLDGDLVVRRNGYRTTDELSAVAFSSSIGWSFGQPSEDGDRYLLGAMLGFTGNRGNTVEEIIDLIDRSVLADGTRPTGTFYYQTTNDEARSGPRDSLFDGSVSAIESLGGSAVNQNGVLPNGADDVLGIMTGAANPNVEGASIGILPGAFCDHLTSWAATFNRQAQTKVSAWIAKGASGSWGTVQEPCNFAGKFPAPLMHALYFQGLTLGEAVFRSAGFVPFQGLLYGDPLARPFAFIPEVTLGGIPDAPTSEDALVLDYAGTTEAPGRAVERFELYVDGVLEASVLDPQPLVLFVDELTDGWHEIRLIGLENSSSEVPGVAFDELVVDRTGNDAAIEGIVTEGDLSTELEFVGIAGGDVLETRLVHNGRVLAAGIGCAERFVVPAASIGAGQSSVRVEALLHDGRRVSSPPVGVDIAFSGFDASNEPPRAVGFTKIVDGSDPLLLELPVLSDDDPGELEFEILEGPAQATLTSGGDAGFRIVRPEPGASGADRLTYRVSGPDGVSAPAEITLLYEPYQLDRDADWRVDLDDLYAQNQDPIDTNFDGVIDREDLRFLERVLRCGEDRDRAGGRR